MWATLEVIDHLRSAPDGQTLPVSARPSPRTKRSATGSWPRLPGTIVVHTQLAKEAVVKKPADHVTLSADEGEALMARVPQSNLGIEDAGVVEWVLRMYGFVALALPEANLSVKRPRDVCVGRGRTAQTSPKPEASAPWREALDSGEAGGESAPVEEQVVGVEAVGCGEVSPKALLAMVDAVPTRILIESMSQRTLSSEIPPQSMHMV